MQSFYDLLASLTRIDGVSGDESRVAAFISDIARRYTSDVRTDRMGSVIAFRKGADSSLPPRMVCAHMDEVGFIVTAVTDDGLLKFASVGGIDARVVIGKRVRIGKVAGVIGICPVHLASDNEKKNTPKLRELYIDIGAKNREDALAHVAPGDYASFTTEPEPFGDRLFKAKAIDDRLGCAVALELLACPEPLPRDTYFVFNTREETNSAGAKAASFAIDPHEALVLEGTTSADVAGVSGEKRVTQLGKGVVISYMDRSAIYSPELFAELKGLAIDNGIPWQMKQLIAGGTDAGAIQTSRAGIPCAGLAAPVRYIHAPVSVVALDDIDAMLLLAKLFIYS